MAKNDLTPNQLKQVETYASLGLSNAKIAKLIGVTRQKLDSLAHQEGAFVDAVASGEAKVTVRILAALVKRATEGDMAAIKYWLKNREIGWSDDTKLELGGSVGVESAITPDAMLRVARTYVKLHGGGEETTGVGDVGETDNG